MRTLGVVTGILLVITSAAQAEPPRPDAILRQMKAWLEPDHSSTRKLTMTIRSAPGDSAQWKAGQARAKLDSGHWVVTVLLEPTDVRGVALLIQEQEGKTGNQWLYLPYLRRVRKLLPVNAFESFLNTEFSYADLGFVDLDDRTLSLLGQEPVGSVPAYQVQEVPSRSDHFKRIVSWVARDDGRPLKREYYDPADRLWMVESFEDVQPVHGIPTAQRVRMEDVQTGYGSEYRATAIDFDIEVPKELFDPGQLAKVADHPIWK